MHSDPMPDNKRPPHVEGECPEAAPSDLAENVRGALLAAFSEALGSPDELSVTLRQGDGAGHLRVAVGPSRRPHLFDFFARDVPGTYVEGPLAVLVAFAQGSLETYFAAERDAYFPLDFVGHPFDGHIVFAKSEVRDFDAEAMADAWLKAHEEV